MTEIRDYERLRCAVQTMLSEDMLAEVDVKMIEDRMGWFPGYLKIQVITSIYAVLDGLERVPLNWWQAVRERWCPDWWLMSHPIKCREIKKYGSLYFRPSDDPLVAARNDYRKADSK